MGSPAEDLARQAVQQGKQMAMNALKETLKGIGKAIWSVITPFLPYIIAAILLLIIIVGCIDWDEVSAEGASSGQYTSISGVSSIGAEYLMSWENEAVRKYLTNNIGYSEYVGKYITEDKQYFICYTDYPDNDLGDRNFAYGVCHTPDFGQTYWHVYEYSLCGIAIDAGDYNEVGVSKIPVSKVNEVFSVLYENYKKEVIQAFNGLEIEDSAIDALTAVKYQYGNIGNAVDLYKSGGNFIEDFCTTDGYYPFNENKRIKGSANRVIANRKLFEEGIYNASDGSVLVESSFNGSNLTEIAINMHNYIKNNRYAYSCTHNVSNGYSNECECDGQSYFGKYGFNEFQNIRCIDCSSFVSWVLNEYLGDEVINTTWSTYKYNDESQWPSNWQKIHIDDLEAGDILVKDGHVEIYIGDGKTVGAGCTNAIRKDYSYGSIQAVKQAFKFGIRVP